MLIDIALSRTPAVTLAPLIARPPAWVDDLLGGATPVADVAGVTVATAAPFAQFTAAIDNASSLSPRELRARVADAYVAIGEAISSRRYHPIRFWNFVPAPGHEMAPGVDRYMVFNAGRYDAYAHRSGPSRAFGHTLATASAVGVQDTVLAIFCLAAQTPGTPVENPRQTPSWQYSRRYGAKPPCFARATILSHARERRLLIGGTASIVGEDSRHVGDPAGQVEETVANLRALITSATAAATHAGADGADTFDRPGLSDVDAIHRLHDVRVYVARTQDAALVRSLVVASCPGMTRLEMTLSEICRPELLVEIEGVAAL